jgi:hypothetical protein
MKPKEKAEELVNKYKPYVYPYVGSSYLTGDEYPEQILSYAKKCASIAVDEILSLFVHECADTIYWTEVKQEIENLITKN